MAPVIEDVAVAGASLNEADYDIIKNVAETSNADEDNQSLVKDLLGSPSAKEAKSLDSDSNISNDDENMILLESTNNESSKENSILSKSVEIEQKQESSFQREEAELDAYLKEKIKPKRRTIAEMLKCMPGFDKIANLKPKIGGKDSDPKKTIELGSIQKPVNEKKEKAMQSLMNRFIIHANLSNDDKNKDHHHKIHINKLEKDSQGMVHAITDEIEYVSEPNNDEDADIFNQTPNSSSRGHKEAIPGEKRFRLQEALQDRIRSKKAKEFQERMKEAEVYKKELEFEDKSEMDEDLPDDEDIIEDDIDISDSDEEEDDDDEDEEDENLVEDDLPIEMKKKQRKRIIFLDDEAEEEDADGNEADESENDGETEDENFQDSKSNKVDFERKKNKKNKELELLDLDDFEAKSLEPTNEDDDIEIGSTPLINASTLLNKRTPSDFWNPFPKARNELTPLIPRVKDHLETESMTSRLEEIPNPIAELIKNSTTNIEQLDDLADLCSGKFPSQPIATPYETQNCFGFFDDEDEDDEIFIESCDKAIQSQNSPSSKPLPTRLTEATVSTPSSTPGQALVNGDTPKMMSEKIVKSRSLGHRFEIEAKQMKEQKYENSTPVAPEKKEESFSDDLNNEKSSDPLKTISPINLDDEEDEEIGVKKITSKKRKRLTFSDDEDDDIKEATPYEESEIEDEVDNNSEPKELEIEEEEEEEIDEDDEEAELERQLKLQSQQEKPAKRKGLFGSNGLLRKKFLDNEAELSGSDEGSGDEDEKGLNYYEQEDGDEEEMDEISVRNQVERAHLKHLLDQDDREVRFLKEEYLERGDLEDGKLRERKFRWTNGDEGWGDEDARMGNSEGELEDDDEEEQKRKIVEIEKRKWMFEHSDIMEATEEESQKQLFENTKFLKLGNKTMRKIESFIDSSSSFMINETSNSVPDTSFSTSTLMKSQITSTAKLFFSMDKKNDAKDKDDFDDSVKLNKATSQPFFASPDQPLSKIHKGSFLNRGAPTLSRLAELTKVNDSSNNIKSNSRNFVFSVVTPPDQQNKQKGPKRPSNSQGMGQPKKIIKMDRSFSNLDESSKDASIFKWM